MHLAPANTPADVLPAYLGTPVEELLRYHNMGEPLPATTGHAHMLISMCMDHRKELLVPHEFAYVLRSAGGTLRDSEFEVSYAIAVGGVRAIAILAHTDCGMVGVTHKRSRFIEGLTRRAGVDAEVAAAQFDRFAGRYEITDAMAFACDEARRMRGLYPQVLVAPLLYQVESDRLSQIVEP